MNSQSYGSVCKDCAERRVGCHGDCPKYADFKARVAEERKAEREAKKLEEYGRSLIVKKPRR